MPQTVVGLPLHPLLVHATVVLVPAAALAVLAAALWPRFRRWGGLLPLALSVVSLVLVPLSTQSGETLEHQVGEAPLVEQHAEMADGLLPWVVVMVVASAGLFYVHLRESGRVRSGPDLRRWLVVAGTVLALAGSVGTAVQVVRIGHSGAKAAWSGVVTPSPLDARRRD